MKRICLSAANYELDSHYLLTVLTLNRNAGHFRMKNASGQKQKQKELKEKYPLALKPNPDCSELGNRRSQRARRKWTKSRRVKHKKNCTSHVRDWIGFGSNRISKQASSTAKSPKIKLFRLMLCKLKKSQPACIPCSAWPTPEMYHCCPD